MSWSIGVAGKKKSGNSICALLTHILKVFVVVRSFSIRPLHRDVFCLFPFWWIYYCHSSQSTGKESGKTNLCALWDLSGFVRPIL